MSPDQRLTIILTCIGLLWVMLVAIVGLIWKNGKRTGEQNTTLTGIAEDVRSTAGALDKHIQWHLDRSKHDG